jgi:hypothetical protein
MTRRRMWKERLIQGHPKPTLETRLNEVVSECGSYMSRFRRRNIVKLSLPLSLSRFE